MSKIIFNKKLSKDFYLMKVSHKNNAKVGQFYMLRAWDEYPVLSRPISIFDADENSLTFLYKVVGEGTEIFATLKEDDEITLQGPNGNGFPIVKGKIAMVGGGVGIAPLYLAAKELKKHSPESSVDLYLGFSDVELLVDKYKSVCDNVTVNVGGFVTDDIDTTAYDYIFTCGPTIMMEVLHKKCVNSNSKATLYVSMENRMACGIGACLVCTCKTKVGNKKVCTDGPVFKAEEVF